MINGFVIDMEKLSEEIKKKLGTEDEPFEGTVPLVKVEESILELISKHRNNNQKFTYLFCDWSHTSAENFFMFMNTEFGLPSFSIFNSCNFKTIQERYKKEKELEGDIPEEELAEL